MMEVLASVCARLYGRRVARDRVMRAVIAAGRTGGAATAA
jgi:predicted site-specific integrase-resolvase